MADTPLDAGRTIAQATHDRTIAAGRTALMTEEQFGEHLLMQETAGFLRQQDINLQIKAVIKAQLEIEQCSPGKYYPFNEHTWQLYEEKTGRKRGG